MELRARERAILGALNAAGAVADLATWNWPESPPYGDWVPLPRQLAKLRVRMTTAEGPYLRAYLQEWLP